MLGRQFYRGLLLALVLIGALPVMAVVELFLLENAGQVELRYRCTEGEQVRFFNLDVRVAKGFFTAVTPALRGESTAATPGYGIFPAAFRDHLTVDLNGDVDWSDVNYLPVAPSTDAPGNTLSGLNSGGVTLEFGSLWNVNRPEDAPLAEGLLCTLTLSEAALVTVEANSIRGGVVLAEGSSLPVVTYQSLDLTPPRITGFTFLASTLTINFEGGELMTSTDLEGDWTLTGNTSGEHVINPMTAEQFFFRVKKP